MDTETKQALPAEQFNAYKELADEATSAEDLATLREMAEADTGSEDHNIEVKDEDGKVQTIKVTDIGKGTLQHVIKPEALAVHSADWHTDEK